MNPIAHIRKTVFDVSQAAFAALAGVSQGTVSKWETGGLEPSRDELKRIRAAALAKGLKWNDRWFFEVPRRES
jgi:DNA-binding transcriptional regulator YiaG